VSNKKLVASIIKISNEIYDREHAKGDYIAIDAPYSLAEHIRATDMNIVYAQRNGRHEQAMAMLKYNIKYRTKKLKLDHCEKS